MSAFLTGDELGSIKCLRYFSGSAGETTTEVKTLLDGTKNENPRGIQALAVATSSNGIKLLAAGYSDGVSAFSLEDNDHLELVHEWTTAISSNQKCVGLAISERGVYSCTNNGRLQVATLPQSDTLSLTQRVSVPTRLYDWRLSPNEETFAYGGYEVDLSVWNTEKAFAANNPASSGTKRTKATQLFPSEIYRAKNVSNDSLGLRQPVRITSLTYLSPSPSATQHHLLTGTQYGDVRRYDTRAARRPIAEWNGIGKNGGISTMEKGLTEHEAFVADHGGNLFVLDLRNGRVAYSYKSIAGTVMSIAPSPSILASTSLDRFARIHSTFPLPLKAGQPQEQKGQVLERVFMKSTPTVVIWDQPSFVGSLAAVQEEKDDEDEVWDGMENIGDDSDAEQVSDGETKSRKNKKRRTA